MCFSLCPCAVTGHSGKSLAVLSVFPPHEILVHIDKIPLTLVFSTLSNHSSLSFSSYERYSCPSVFLEALGWTWSSKSMSLLSWGGKPAGKTGNLVHLTLVLYEVHLIHYSSTVHTCRLYRLMKLQENQIIFLSAVRMKEMPFSSWRSLYYPTKLWNVSSANQLHSVGISLHHSVVAFAFAASDIQVFGWSNSGILQEVELIPKAFWSAMQITCPIAWHYPMVLYF